MYINKISIVYEVVFVSHCGMGNTHIALYTTKENAEQRVREEVIKAQDCPFYPDDYRIEIIERKLNGT